MKKSGLTLTFCVIFIMLAACLTVGLFSIEKLHVFADNLEENDLEFYLDNKTFNYDYKKNIKKSSQFDLDYELNKYSRFSTSEERKILMRKMVALNFDNFVIVNYLFPSLDDLILKMEKTIFVAPKNANLKINSDSEKVFFITPEVVGRKLDREKLYKNIIDNFLLNKPLKFKLPLIKLNPEIVSGDFEKFAHLRADFATDFSSSSIDRKHNIKNALTSLNKIEIAPSQIFSFNKTIGRRTKENGYREAKIIVNNEFVDGIGGGVCQVSTTLYNSALMAGLQIVEANKHSKQIGYVKYGFDAMVNFGSSDLKFKNNTNEKITIITSYKNNKARIRIFGSKPNCTYKLTNEIVSVTEPNEQILIDEKGEYLDKVQYEDEFFYLKKGTRGMEVKSYRETYRNGELIKRELLRLDKFKPTDAVKVYGTKKRKEEIFAPMVFH